MFKTLLFQLHWLLGISAGAVLSLMAVTGAMLAFEDELLRQLNPELAAIVQRYDQGRVALPPTELLRRLGVERQAGVSRLTVDPSGAHPSRLRVETPQGRLEVYFDPFTGHELTQLRGREAFRLIESVHRRLAAGERGKAVTGVCVITLLFFCISGLYLRWPRRWYSPRTWLAVEWRRQGRSFLWSLHSVIGTWCLLIYTVIALTGLWWSYSGYRQTMIAWLGGTPTQRGSEHDRQRQHYPVLDLSALQRIVAELPQARQQYLDMRFPASGSGVIEVRQLPATAAHSRAYDLWRFDQATGAVVEHAPYAALAAGPTVLASVFALHSGQFFGLGGRVAWMLAALCMPVFFITGWMLYLDRRRNKRALRAVRQVEQGAATTPLVEHAANTATPWLVVFASQSGFGERLAWQAAGQLRCAGATVEVVPLARLQGTTLQTASRVLLVISTFGDGEPPDSARGIERRLLRHPLPLAGVEYALLALGDRQYARFCGFARQVEQWLVNHGAQALFPTVDVDNADPNALERWRQQLARLSGVEATAVESDEPRLQSWRLRRRECLNPGSEGGEIWRIELQPPTDVRWQAGDILEIQPQQPDAAVLACLQSWQLPPETRVTVAGDSMSLRDAAARCVLVPPGPKATAVSAQAWFDALVPLPRREYSIASTTAEGVCMLVVRLVHAAPNRPGLGSGWLCRHAPIDGEVRARVRENPGFRRAGDVPMLLIGNGTGIAGLRALLAEAEQAGCAGHWLLFGERHATHDRLFAVDIADWAASGHLARADQVFSRDQPDKQYVQHRLREAADALRDWLAGGAVIHVCGSLRGMAQEVDGELRRQLGDEAVDSLAAQGRYRRDVY